MQHSHHHHTSTNSRAAVAQRSGSSQSQAEEEEAIDRVGAMIDETIAMLEGQQGVGVFCVYRAAQAQAVHEERPYSRGSIQASLQAAPPADNNHASLSTEGTWGASRAALWMRLPPPGPPTPSTPNKPNASRG
ncbi:hypothetical protein M436DRAFT_78674 [Aureobasidium namibiae CBS 147.97]|uniref:Uncharacterized protein n=1 Tax=Aureobasidium namibiae CBS 147.97 TaxID=1043004 RepID=A0A074WZM2_9PEZI